MELLEQTQEKCQVFGKVVETLHSLRSRTSDSETAAARHENRLNHYKPLIPRTEAMRAISEYQRALENRRMLGAAHVASITEAFELDRMVHRLAAERFADTGLEIKPPAELQGSQSLEMLENYLVNVRHYLELVDAQVSIGPW